MGEIWIAGVAAAVVGGVATGYAANKASGAANKAANTQADMFNTITANEQPYMQAGNDATTKLSDLLGTSNNKTAAGYGSLTSNFSPADYLANQDPGYGFQLQTGAQALRNADTPGVGSLSGASLKDLMGFNQGMAATGYQNAFNRYQSQQNNVYSRLAGLAQLGQNAASNTGQQGTTLAGNQGQAILAGGNATANGIQGVGNGLGNAAMYAFLNNNQSTPSTVGGGYSPSAGAAQYGSDFNPGGD